MAESFAECTLMGGLWAPCASGATTSGFKMKGYIISMLLYFCSLTHCDGYVNKSAYFMLSDFWCLMDGGAEEPRVEYLVDWYFNQELTMRYNSTVGKWTGLSRAGTITASELNADTHDLWQRKLEKKLICENNIPSVLNATRDNMVEPAVSLQWAEPSISHRSSTLRCSAHNFYPPLIGVTWWRHGQEVTAGVTRSDVMSNGDWTYQVHSYLELEAGQEHSVACVVEHASLKTPTRYTWDGSWTTSERNCVLAGVFSVLIGAAFFFTGLFKYRRRRCITHC